MSSRIRAFCQLFRCMGYSVHVIALYTKQSQFTQGEVYNQDGYTFEIISKNPPRSIDTFIRNPSLLSKINTFLIENEVSFLFSDACQCYFSSILKIANSANIPYYVEQCEKYDISSYKLKRLDIRYRKFLQLYTHGFKKSNGIIVISRFLEKHYSNQGTRVIRIPTILEIENIPFSSNTCNKRIRLVYMGVTGRNKELLSPIIRVFSNDKNISTRFEFHVYGTTKTQLLKYNPKLKKDLLYIGDSITFFGVVPQKEVQAILVDADYQIFIRPYRESSEAGFPTKLGESMAAGTPVISNLTGDIGLYLQDRRNGFVLHDTSENSLERVLKTVLSLSNDEKRTMRLNARTTAEKYFNYKMYVDSFFNLIYTVDNG